MASRLYKPTLGDILMPNSLVAPMTVFCIVGMVISSHGTAFRQRALERR